MCCVSIVSASQCDNVMAFRNWAKRVRNSRMIFLDETALRLNEARKRTLVMPNETQYVVVAENSSYAARYDALMCCNSERIFPPVIWSPEDRKRLNVDGVTSGMVENAIENLLAQAIGSVDDYPLYIVLDNSPAHNKQRMLEAFHMNGAQNVVDVVFMPANAAHRLSPLDNSLFSVWKRKCRKRSVISKSNIVQVMADCWNEISSDTIQHYYTHCGLTHTRVARSDCPAPTVHEHER